MAIGERARRDERVDQLRGHDQIAEAQRREEHLAERARVDHARRPCRAPAAPRAAGPRSGTRCRSRPPGSRRPLALAHSSSASRRCQAHGHAERVLVGRRDVDEPGPVRRARATLRRRDPRRRPAPAPSRTPGRDQGAARARVAGVLDPGGVAGIEEHPRRQIDGLLSAGHDDDLRRLAAHGARLAEVGGDRLAKRRVARGITVVEELPWDSPPAPGDEPGPEVEGKGVEARQARPERLGRDRRDGNAAAHAQELRAAAGQPRAPARPLGPLDLRARPEERLRQRAGDGGPGADAALEVALGQELAERGEHGVARRAEVVRQRARRRQARSRPEPIPTGSRRAERRRAGGRAARSRPARARASRSSRRPGASPFSSPCRRDGANNGPIVWAQDDLGQGPWKPRAGREGFSSTARATVEPGGSREPPGPARSRRRWPRRAR